MAMTIKAALAAVGSAALLAGCAAGPYYQDSYYQDYGYGYGYDRAPAYYDPGYVAPSVGFGITYIDRDEYRRDRRDDRRRDWRGDGRNRDWRGDRGERSDGYGSRDWRDDHGQRSGG